jgi:hypothetical protein
LPRLNRKAFNKAQIAKKIRNIGSAYSCINTNDTKIVSRLQGNVSIHTIARLEKSTSPWSVGGWKIYIREIPRATTVR